MHEILFRGFHAAEDGLERVFINGEWIVGHWVEGYLLPAENTMAIYDPTDNQNSSIWSYGEVHMWGPETVIPETICPLLAYTDDSKKRIGHMDILQVITYYGATYNYLVQWIDEGQEFQAIPLHEGDDISGSVEEYFCNFSNSTAWTNFIPCILQDVYGHNKELKILGNVWSYPNLINEIVGEEVC